MNLEQKESKRAINQHEKKNDEIGNIASETESKVIF